MANLLEDLDIEKFTAVAESDAVTMSFRLHETVRNKYLKLQDRTNRRAGKLIKEVIIKTIDALDEKYGKIKQPSQE